MKTYLFLFCLSLATVAGQARAFSHPAPALFTSDQMYELTKEFMQHIHQSPQVIRDPQANHYLQMLGQRLSTTPSADGAYYQFFLVNQDDINAFAGPGGYIGINTGLVLASENESELAAVIAHEIAHVRQKHIERNIDRADSQRIPLLAGSLAALALGIVNPVLGGSALAVGVTGIMQTNINIIRAQEKEADHIGIQILHEANFNPHAMASFFDKLHQQTRLSYLAQVVPSILLTHPVEAVRISDAENRAETMDTSQIRESNDYVLFREYIRVLTGRPTELMKYYQAKLKKTDDLALQYGNALTQIKNQHYREAQNCLNILLAQDPQRVAFQLAQAQLYQEQNQDEQALMLLSELHRIHPKHYAITHTYAHALLFAKQPAKASQLLETLVAEHPEDSELWFILARAHAANNQKAQAYVAQAQGLFLLGEEQQAEQHLRHASELIGN